MGKEPKAPAKKAKRRPAIHRSKAPGLAPPILAYMAFTLLMVALSYLQWPDEADTMLIIGGVTLFFLLFLPCYMVYSKLKHRVVRIVLALTLPIWVLGPAAILYASIRFPEPVFQGELTRQGREMAVPLPTGAYHLFVTGAFPRKEAESPEGKKQKTASLSRRILKGKFLLTLEEASGSRGKTFSGKFEQGSVRRKLSKKGRGSLRVEEMSRLFTFRIKKNKSYRLKLSNLDEQLSDSLRFSVTPRSNWYVVSALLAMLAMVALAFVDFLMKNARERSLFALGLGVSYGFVIYLRLCAMPVMPVVTLVTAIVVGAAVGTTLAVILEWALAKPFKELNRRWRISI